SPQDTLEPCEPAHGGRTVARALGTLTRGGRPARRPPWAVADALAALFLCAHGCSHGAAPGHRALRLAIGRYVWNHSAMRPAPAPCAGSKRHAWSGRSGAREPALPPVLEGQGWSPVAGEKAPESCRLRRRASAGD